MLNGAAGCQSFGIAVVFILRLGNDVARWVFNLLARLAIENVDRVQGIVLPVDGVHRKPGVVCLSNEGPWSSRPVIVFTLFAYVVVWAVIPFHFANLIA